MNFLNNLKSFLFGSSNQQSQPDFPQRQHSENYYEEDAWENHEEPQGFTRNFDIFSDPLQMHQYFQQEINEMLRNFGFSEFGSHSSFDNFQSNLPQLEDVQPPQTGRDNLREQFLKKGYEKPTQRALQERVDKDIDAEVQSSNFDSIFGQSRTDSKPTRQLIPRSFFHGQSTSMKTIRHSDGSIETHTTVKDSEGNEETTVKKIVGDKEVSITKKRNKDGQEEIIENLINVDETEKNKFLPNLF